jgi:quercetin dioxygenase-like cupin family protein
MATVIPVEELRRTATAALFEGGDEAAISIFVTEFERGQGPALHLHPYPEVFVVQTGTAAFTVGDEEQRVTGGHVVSPRRRRPTASSPRATTRFG